MPTPIPLLDLTRDAALLDELSATADRVIRSGRYILGPEVQAFEAECADYLGASHAVGVSSGTDALLLALMALEIGAGDEVICPTYTFFATAGAVWRTGAKPVFVDIDPVTFNLDPAAVAAARTERTKAVIAVHLYGQCADMTALSEVVGDLPIIEDAAQAIGADHGGVRAGALGTVGCFSFFPSKNLGALGDGGLVTCMDDALAERLRVLRVHGGKPKYHHRIVGGNFRLDSLQAALLRVKLPRLDAAIAARQAAAARYAERLAGLEGVSAPAVGSDRHVFHQYCVRVHGGRRDALQAHLTDHDVGSAIYYPVPLHVQECFAEMGWAAGDLPHSELAASETLALPMFPDLRPDESARICDLVEEFLG